MKRINLAEPFEKISVALSSLPLTDSSLSPRRKEPFKQTKVTHLLREIYEAANGRQVATTIGLVAIAPPIAPYLKDKPFCVNTQAEFFSQALARIADGIPSDLSASGHDRHSIQAAAVWKQAQVLSTKNEDSSRAAVPDRAISTNDSQKGSCMRVV